MGEFCQIPEELYLHFVLTGITVVPPISILLGIQKVTLKGSLRTGLLIGCFFVTIWTSIGSLATTVNIGRWTGLAGLNALTCIYEISEETVHSIMLYLLYFGLQSINPKFKHIKPMYVVPIGSFLMYGRAVIWFLGCILHPINSFYMQVCTETFKNQ